LAAVFFEVMIPMEREKSRKGPISGRTRLPCEVTVIEMMYA